jgi:hypothetical protein
MADAKITDLTELAQGGTATGDMYVLVDVSDSTMAATGTDKKQSAQSAAQDLDGMPRAIATYTQTNYTFVLGDRGKIVELSTAAAKQAVIPLNANVAFPVGTQLDIVDVGSGVTTVTTQAGVTILKNGNVGLTLNTTYSVVSLYKRATDSWVLTGDLT